MLVYSRIYSIYTRRNIMQKTVSLLLLICISICSSLYAAELDLQSINEVVRTVLSQEFFDTNLSKDRDKIRQYTRETFPDLYNTTVQEQEGSCLYKLTGVIELCKETDNSSKSRKYPLYWLSLAQALADTIKDEDQKSKAAEWVHNYTKCLLLKTRLKQIETMEKEIALLDQIVNHLKNEDAK